MSESEEKRLVAMDETHWGPDAGDPPACGADGEATDEVDDVTCSDCLEALSEERQEMMA